MRYGYDPGGNVTAIVDPVFGTQSLRYDDLDRLISATGPYPGQATRMFGYDTIGNLTLHCTLGDLGYPASGPGSVRPHAVTSSSLGSYAYDNNGNLLTAPGGFSILSGDYDFENRPKKISKGGTTTDLAYHDLLGRVTKTASGTTTTYVGRWYECTGGTCRKYIFAGDQRIAFKEGSTVTYVHPDHLSSSSVLTKGADGTKDEQLTYFPFGQTRTDTDGAGNPISPGFRYKYTDQEFDDTTGLYYYKARYYDQVLGRFIQPDPIVPDVYDPQSLNLYSYVLNNPLRYTDPFGLQQDPIVYAQPVYVTPPWPGIYQFGNITTSINPATFSFAPGAANAMPRVEVFAPSAGPGFAITAGVTAIVTPQAAGASPFPSISLPQPSFLDIASVVLPFIGLGRGIASAIIGRDIETGAPVSPVELPIILATQGKAPSGIGKVASSTLGSVKFLSAKEIAKRLGVTREVFHTEVKRDIVQDFNVQLRRLGTTNPDIGIDALGNIVLRSPQTGKTILTDVPLGSYSR